MAKVLMYGLPCLTLITGLIVFLASFLIEDVAKRFEVDIVQKRIKILPDNLDVWRSFKYPQSSAGAPMEFVTYAFNLTNPQAVLEGETPVVKEVGPFIYDMYESKKNIRLNDSDNTLTYDKIKIYVYNEGKTTKRQLIEKNEVVDINTPINTFNIPYITVLNVLKQRAGGIITAAFRRIIESLNSANYIITSRPIQELFWGYNDELLVKLSRWDSSIDPFVHIFTNNTFDIDNKVYTGNQSPTNVGEYIQYNNSTRFNCWENTSINAGKIEGTDGYRFPPYMSATAAPKLLINDIYRSVRMEHINDEYHYQLPTRVFTIAKEEFYSAINNNDNYKYDSLGYNGVFNITRCQKNAPIFLSNPHFFGADQKFTENVKGLEPREDIHRSKLWVDKKTGIVMKSRFGFQINVHLDDDVTKKTKIKPLYFPVARGGQNSQASYEKATDLYNKLYAYEKATAFLGSRGTSLGFFISIVGGIWYVLVHLYYKRKKRRAQLNEQLRSQAVCLHSIHNSNQPNKNSHNDSQSNYQSNNNKNILSPTLTNKKSNIALSLRTSPYSAPVIYSNDQNLSGQNYQNNPNYNQNFAPNFNQNYNQNFDQNFTQNNQNFNPNFDHNTQSYNQNLNNNMFNDDTPLARAFAEMNNNASNYNGSSYNPDYSPNLHEKKSVHYNTDSPIRNIFPSKNSASKYSASKYSASNFDDIPPPYSEEKNENIDEKREQDEKNEKNEKNEKKTSSSPKIMITPNADGKKGFSIEFSE